MAPTSCQTYLKLTMRTTCSDYCPVMSPRPDSNYADTCAYCVKPVGRANLRKCSQCRWDITWTSTKDSSPGSYNLPHRMVCYCSRTCQKAAWKTHKKSCATTANLRAQMEADEDVRELNNDLSTWLGYWRAHLHMFSLSALDLANHPPDRLATHWWVSHILFDAGGRETELNVAT